MAAPAPPSPLAYEPAPQRLATEPGVGTVRVTLPVNADVRRVFAWSFFSRVWRFAGPFAIGGGLVLRAAIGFAWPQRFWVGVAIATGLMLGSLVIGSAAAWSVGWVVARRLRPVTVDVADTVTVTSWRRRPRVVRRDAVDRVRVARLGRSRMATVHLSVRSGSVVPLWYGTVDAAEAAAVALRTALDLPAATGERHG